MSTFAQIKRPHIPGQPIIVSYYFLVHSCLLRETENIKIQDIIGPSIIPKHRDK
jgi:hypothetical protein